MITMPGMAAASLSEWLIYGFSALVVVVCLGVIARAVLIPSDVRRTCCCGACGYSITNPLPERCPECGGILTKVGISTPAMAVRLRGGLGWAILAWTIVCGTLAQIGWGLVQQSAWAAATTASVSPSVAFSSTQSRTSKFTPSRSMMSGPRATQGPDELDFRVESSMSYTTGAHGADSGSATITLHRNGTADHADLELDLAAKTFELKDGAGATVQKGKAADVDAALVRRWFDAAGIGTAGSGSAAAQADCKKLIDACVNDPDGIDSLFQGFTQSPGSLTYNGGSSSSGPVGGFSTIGFMSPTPSYWTTRTQLIALVLGLLYIGGCIGIWWRRRTLLA